MLGKIKRNLSFWISSPNLKMVTEIEIKTNKYGMSQSFAIQAAQSSGFPSVAPSGFCLVPSPGKMRQAALLWSLPSWLGCWGWLTSSALSRSPSCSHEMSGSPGFFRVPISFRLCCLQTTATSSRHVASNTFDHFLALQLPVPTKIPQGTWDTSMLPLGSPQTT